LTVTTRTSIGTSGKWSMIRQDQVDKYLPPKSDFIDEEAIFSSLERHRSPAPSHVREILAKSMTCEALSPDDTATLLNVEDPALLAEMAEAAATVKKKVYDNRIVTFAPLYLSNLCVNNCLYCGFRADNKDQLRRRLTLDEVRAETKILAGEIGHKRLIVVYGEHPESSTEYITETIEAIYGVSVGTRRGTGQIRRVNVNAAPLPIEDLRVLKDVGIGTFQVFQETYHHETYRRVHPANTLKGNYRWRLTCMHRAQEAGVDDVGLGVLFGLYDWKFEVMGLLSHAHELEKELGVGPHTISFPRLEPAHNAKVGPDSQYAVDDEEYKRLVTVLRLAVPYTGLIITARETPAIRDEMIPRGCTQTDASTRIGVGAYSDFCSEQEADRQQFMLGDTRSLETLICDLARRGIITSFCTAGYRCGRTGTCIMDMLKSGKEGKLCKVNAVLTFREWLDDFASPEALTACTPVIESELAEIRNATRPDFFAAFTDRYNRICRGERDLYF